MSPVAGEAHDHVSAKGYDILISRQTQAGPGHGNVGIVDAVATTICAKSIAILA